MRDLIACLSLMAMVMVLSCRHTAGPVTLHSGSAAPAGDVYLQLGPMIGHVGPDEARIWVKASGRARLSIRWSLRDDLRKAKTTNGPLLAVDADYMGQAHITGLTPSTRYFYSVLLNGKSAMARPYPSFVTAPPPGAKGKFRFAFGSCVGRKRNSSAAAWDELAARGQNDFLLMLGDNHYADSTEPAKQRAAYYAQRGVAGFRELTRRTPTYGIWDDHDFGPDNSDGTALGKETSLRTFKQFWGNPAYGQPDDPGIYSTFSWGGADFFLLDVRYHRSPNRAPNNRKKTMLGSRQLAWLKRELLASRAALKFIASGSEWQMNGSNDSWTRFKHERREIFDFIRDNEIQGVILLSGDRHFTGGYQIEGRLIEITAGPFGSGAFKSRNLPDMFMNHTLAKYYCVMEVDTSGPEPLVTLEVYRVGERKWIDKRAFTWDEINGVKKIPTLRRP